jgi:hypothetical protein
MGLLYLLLPESSHSNNTEGEEATGALLGYAISALYIQGRNSFFIIISDSIYSKSFSLIETLLIQRYSK